MDFCLAAVTLGAINIDLDVYQRALVLLKGEQNKILPCVGSEQHAAPCTPHPFPFSLSLDTHMHGIGTAPVQRTIDPHLGVLKQPHLCKDPLEEPGGVGLPQACPHSWEGRCIDPQLCGH